jgi:F0F1-type ATP synthase delta subunit
MYPQAPIQIFGIEGRYAHALYSAASKKNALDKVEKELTQVAVGMEAALPSSWLISQWL